MIPGDETPSPAGGYYPLGTVCPPTVPTSASGPRIAGIFSHSLYRNLKPVARLLPLDENDWSQIVHEANLDLLMIEPTSSSSDLQWRFLAQNPKKKAALSHLLELADRRRIPVVLWLNCDAQDFERVSELAQLVGNCIYFDPALGRALHSLGGVRALCLPLPLQPELFRSLGWPNAPRPILLNGLSHVLRHFHEYRYLQSSKARRIDLIDDAFHILPTSLDDISWKLHAELVGFAPPPLMPYLLQKYRVLLIPRCSLLLPQSRVKRILDALAVGLSVVSMWQPPVWFQERVLATAGTRFTLVETPDEAVNVAHSIAKKNLRTEPIAELINSHDISLHLSKALQTFG